MAISELLTVRFCPHHAPGLQGLASHVNNNLHSLSIRSLLDGHSELKPIAIGRVRVGVFEGNGLNRRGNDVFLLASRMKSLQMLIERQLDEVRTANPCHDSRS